MRIDGRTGQSEASGERLEAALEALRQECGTPPEAPGFLAGFRTRRDGWIDGGAQTAAWRLLALRLAPAGGLAAAVAMVLTLGMDSSPPEIELSAPPVSEVEDPLAVGLEEAGVATVAVNDEDAGYELLAVLYEPLGTR